MIAVTDKVKDPKWAKHEDDPQEHDCKNGPEDGCQYCLEHADEMPEGENVQDLELEEQQDWQDHQSRQYEMSRYQSASRDYSTAGRY